MQSQQSNGNFERPPRRGGEISAALSKKRPRRGPPPPSAYMSPETSQAMGDMLGMMGLSPPANMNTTHFQDMQHMQHVFQVNPPASTRHEDDSSSRVAEARSGSAHPPFRGQEIIHPRAFVFPNTATNDHQHSSRESFSSQQPLSFSHSFSGTEGQDLHVPQQGGMLPLPVFQPSVESGQIQTVAPAENLRHTDNEIRDGFAYLRTKEYHDSIHSQALLTRNDWVTSITAVIPPFEVLSIWNVTGASNTTLEAQIARSVPSQVPCSECGLNLANSREHMKRVEGILAHMHCVPADQAQSWTPSSTESVLTCHTSGCKASPDLDTILGWTGYRNAASSDQTLYHLMPTEKGYVTCLAAISIPDLRGAMKELSERNA